MIKLYMRPVKIMQCNIIWNKLSLSDWESRFLNIRRSNLLQSYDYAQSVCPVENQKAQWGQVFIDGEEAGLVQIFEVGFIANFIHGVMLDRGPLWFCGYGKQEHIDSFFIEFNRHFPRRLGRRRRLLPEAEHLNCPSIKKLDRVPYQTIWLDLSQELSALRAGLEKKWRNALSKAERSQLQIIWDEKNEPIDWLLTNYQSDRETKEYRGPHPKLIKQFAKVFGSKGRMMVGKAFLSDQSLEDEPIAAILLLCHGQSATYQLGWSSEAGRKHSAHNLLLWQGVCRLKDKGIIDFDLGGVNEETAKNVKKFKSGMGGQCVVYAGHYI